MDSGLAALLGAVVGGSVTFIGTWLQAKQQTKREFVKIAADLALKEFDARINRKQTVMPLESFVTYYVNYVGIIKNGKVSLEDLKQFRKSNEEMSNYYNSPEANIR